MLTDYNDNVIIACEKLLSLSLSAGIFYRENGMKTP
jgi:hypothetical protein